MSETRKERNRQLWQSRKRNDRRKKAKKQKKHWRNEHHLLFPKQKWEQSFYGKKLRDHRYFRRFIPENTLHRYIHDANEATMVPLPPPRACERAYFRFLKLYDMHQVSANHDTMEQRLQVLIDLWSEYPATVEALKAQKEIVIKFYSRGKY